jgi:cell division septation protein DedD
VSEPRTHYQVSFTGKQALSLFVGLLAALGLSYFFGLMTGLSGREPAGAAATQMAENTAQPPAPTPATGAVAEEPSGGPARENLTFPVPVTAARPPAQPRASQPQPGPRTTIHVFEDGEGAEGAPERPTPRAAVERPTAPRSAPQRTIPPRGAPPAPAGGFRIQVLSVSSRADAEAEAAKLTRSGLPARVEPGNGPRGTVYRVRVGPFATREEAEQANRRLSSQGRRDAWIVPPGQ